jgi:hypothetical protein
MRRITKIERERNIKWGEASKISLTRVVEAKKINTKKNQHLDSTQHAYDDGLTILNCGRV